MVRERRLRETEIERSARGLVADGESPDYREPGGVAQRVEYGGHSLMVVTSGKVAYRYGFPAQVSYLASGEEHPVHALREVCGEWHD